jgi:cytoskeletal protein RodZ
MIGRHFLRAKAEETVEPTTGFDAFELRLGDLMRGERATMGKSLLDVQRELKIKAAYIAAIENCDPTAFDTPGFIAGYVRSYARYLGMDPDISFATFCAESGFRPAHGMSADASSVRPVRAPVGENGMGRDIFSSSMTPFIPAGESIFAGIEPRAIGSIAVLVAVIAGLGWGGWSVLQEVQKVQFAPVEQAPTVVAEVDPLAGGALGPQAEVMPEVSVAAASPEALDRLYRPRALDVPVLVARDGPIATLSPSEVGAFVTAEATVSEPRAGEVIAEAAPADPGATPLVQVTDGPAPELVLVAVRPAWVRVRSAEGTTLYEKIMDAGETWEVPATEDPATLRVGESGAIYFAVNGVPYGPAGPRGSVTSNLALATDSLTQTYAVADLSSDSDLAEIVQFAQVQIAPGAEPGLGAEASE